MEAEDSCNYYLNVDFSTTGKKLAAMKDPEKSGLRSPTTNDMPQTISLFKKYLLTRSQNNNIGATNAEELKIIRTCPSDASSIPVPICNPTFNRPPSMPEKKLLPQMRSNGVLPSFTSGDRSSTAQLTIFYDGAINVYDNVPIDEAQAIMLLAGESSLSNTSITESPEVDTEAPTHQSNVTPRSKLKTDLPVARRHSLQSFLQKRRDRKLIKKSPYAYPIPSSRNKGDVTMNEEGPYQNQIVK